LCFLTKAMAVALRRWAWADHFGSSAEEAVRLQEALAAAVALGDAARLRADTAAASLAEAHHRAVSTAQAVERRLAGVEADHARRLAFAAAQAQEAARSSAAAQAECEVLRLALQQAEAETLTVREAAAVELERLRLLADASAAAAVDAADAATRREQAKAQDWQAAAAAACTIALRATRDSQDASTALQSLLAACEESEGVNRADSSWGELNADDSTHLRTLLCCAAPALRGAGRRAQSLAANAAVRRILPPGECTGPVSAGDAMFLLRGRAALLGSLDATGCRPLLSAPDCGRRGLPEGGGASDDAPGEIAAAELAAAALSGIFPDGKLLSLSDDCVVASLPRSAVISLFHAGHGAVEAATSKARMAPRMSDARVDCVDHGSAVAALCARVAPAQALLTKARDALLREKTAVRQPSPETVDAVSPEASARAFAVDSLLADLEALCPGIELLAHQEASRCNDN